VLLAPFFSFSPPPRPRLLFPHSRPFCFQLFRRGPPETHSSCPPAPPLRRKWACYITSPCSSGTPPPSHPQQFLDELFSYPPLFKKWTPFFFFPPPLRTPNFPRCPVFPPSTHLTLKEYLSCSPKLLPFSGLSFLEACVGFLPPCLVFSVFAAAFSGKASWNHPTPRLLTCWNSPRPGVPPSFPNSAGCFRFSATPGFFPPFSFVLLFFLAFHSPKNSLCNILSRRDDFPHHPPPPQFVCPPPFLPLRSSPCFHFLTSPFPPFFRAPDTPSLSTSPVHEHLLVLDYASFFPPVRFESLRLSLFTVPRPSSTLFFCFPPTD